MKALIWKELRENAKWGVLAALALGLIYAYFLSQYISNYSRYNLNGDILPTLFTAPIAGLLLGLIQVLPELRRDQWAFLVHRPISRARIFWAKAIAGLAIYLPATLLPFGIAMFWLATSNRITVPFDWRFMLAGLADTAGGIVFYLAGLLTAIRPARWYGSRATVIGAGVLCLLIMWQMSEFHFALIIGVVFGLVLLPATLGSFRTRGEYQGQPKFNQAALGVVLFTGNAVACCAVIAFFAILISSQLAYPPSSWTSYEVDSTGEILRVTWKNSDIKSMTDLNGSPVPIPTVDPENRNTNRFLDKGAISNTIRITPSFRSPGRYYALLNNGNTTENDARWYYHRPAGLVMAYSPHDSRWLGYLTPQGFVPYEKGRTLDTMPRFKGDLLTWRAWPITNVLIFRDAVYICDFERWQIRKLLDADPNDPFVLGTELTDTYGYQKMTNAIVVITKNQIQGLSRQGKLLFKVPLSYLDKGYVPYAISMMARQDRWYVWYRPAYGPSQQELPSYVDEIERGKSTVTHHTLPPVPWRFEETERQGSLIGLLSGPAFVAVLVLILGAEIAGVLPWLLGWSLLGGFLSAIPTYFVGRRCAFPKAIQWAWTIGVFLFGPFALLTLLSLRAWPARRTCPSCEKLRVVDRESCEHCGAAWPEPTRDGTEIFEEVRRQAA